jgi:hypothetical protein
MLVKPQFGADEETHFGLMALNDVKIVFAALIPGCLPETFLLGQLVFVVDSLIARGGIPAKSLIQMAAIVYNRPGAKKGRRREFPKTGYRLISGLDGGLAVLRFTFIDRSQPRVKKHFWKQYQIAGRRFDMVAQCFPILLKLVRLIAHLTDRYFHIHAPGFILARKNINDTAVGGFTQAVTPTFKSHNPIRKSKFAPHFRATVTK